MTFNAGPARLILQMKSMNGTSDGFQINSTFKSNRRPLLIEFRTFKHFINEITPALGLKRSGEFYFNFADTGFTGIVCFNGSHLSLHADPLSELVRLDIFLSDRLLNNLNLAEIIYRNTAEFFDSTVLEESYASL